MKPEVVSETMALEFDSGASVRVNGIVFGLLGGSIKGASTRRVGRILSPDGLTCWMTPPAVSEAIVVRSPMVSTNAYPEETPVPVSNWRVCTSEEFNR